MTSQTRARIDATRAEELYENLSVREIGAEADAVRQRIHPDRTVTYIVDRNINYTNVCIVGCTFCAFHRRPGDASGYVLSDEEIHDKIRELLDAGGCGILIQGGLNPRLGIDYFIRLFRSIRERFPGIHIHGLSAEEIRFLSRTSGRTHEDVLRTLQDAGLKSLPGGGAEILVERQRKLVHRLQCTADEWFEIHRTAHRLGMRTTCTQVIGFGETVAERIQHLQRLREIQDETGGFTAFIPWTYQSAASREDGPTVSSTEYLRHLALCRLFLDNIPNLQTSWPTQGEKIGQIGLFFGANDMSGTMMEENVVSAAGTVFRTTETRIRRLIEDAGFIPRRRNYLYERLET